MQMTATVNPHSYLRYGLGLSFLVAVSLFLVGCNPQFVAYHSTASVPYSASSTASEMVLVTGPEENANDREYIVLKGHDETLSKANQGSAEYVLIAPKTGPSTAGYSVDSANMRRAVPLPGSTLDELIEGLAKALSQWDQSVGDGEAVFYEFMHAPEQEIQQVSENVVEWTPSFRFQASHIPEGPTARMLLGNSPREELQYIIEFDDRADVKDFRDTLIQAQSTDPASK